MHTDVLIVGAGPTGLMLANQLGRRGIRAVIIDRHAGPSLQTRALGVQARTLEIYQQLGIADRAIALGKLGTGANVWAEGRHMGHVPLGVAGKNITPYPYILVLGQDDNERIMGDRLRDWNMEVQWNTELNGIKPHANHVEVSLRQPDGSPLAMTASWVAGCDGARSTMRQLSGIQFPGAAYEHVFFVADTDVTGNMIPNEVNVYLWKSGFHLFFPMRGSNHWRIVGILPFALRGKTDVTFDDVTPSVRGEAGASLDIRSCSWFSTYRIHHRSAEQFRAGRCFLLGDAAHIHSPVGAQGMNTGLQDAYNLGWKLALVVKGQAKAALLDTYEQERLPVAKQLLNTTDRAFRLVVSESWLAGILRTKILARVAALAMRRERIQRLAFRAVSQTGIHYRSSPLAQSLQALPQSAPQPGDRFPWLQLKFQPHGVAEDAYAKFDGLRFHLIVFGQSLQNAEAIKNDDLLRVHLIPADPENEAEIQRAQIPAVSFYLVRPDGYIGASGVNCEPAAILAYLTEKIGCVWGKELAGRLTKER